MEDRRCKLGLQGRLELVLLIEQGSTLRAAAAALSVAPGTAHRWWHRWCDASPADRASRVCLRTRSSRPGSCPWALSSEDEQAILVARQKTNRGPMQLAFLTGRHRSTIWKVLHRHGVRASAAASVRRPHVAMSGPRPARCCTSTRSSCPSSIGPGTGRTAIAPSPIARATRGRSRSSASSTTTPAWPIASCTPPRTPRRSQPPSGAPPRGWPSRAAARCRRS